MKLRTLIIGAAMSLAFVATAFADVTTAAAPGLTWGDALAPFAPYIVAALAGLIIAFLGWVTALIQRWTGYQITAAQRAQLHSAAETAAGKIWAAADIAIAKQQIKVGDPRLQTGIEWVLGPGARAAAEGLKTSRLDVENLIVAKLGQMQASSPPAAAA